MALGPSWVHAEPIWVAFVQISSFLLLDSRPSLVMVSQDKAPNPQRFTSIALLFSLISTILIVLMADSNEIYIANKFQ